MNFAIKIKFEGVGINFKMYIIIFQTSMSLKCVCNRKAENVVDSFLKNFTVDDEKTVFNGVSVIDDGTYMPTCSESKSTKIKLVVVCFKM